MRTLKSILIICFCLSGLLLNKQDVQAQPAEYVSIQTFYDDLAPYGVWMNDPRYGYVWVPDVPVDFHPYSTNGYWVMTSYGNTWISLYPWGWAPFHYGRWTYDPYYGWIWVPGYEWAPAWVCWRWGVGYYGWTPLGPGVIVGMSLASYQCPVSWWIFIPSGHIHDRRFHSYTYGPRRVKRIINSTAIIDNIKENPYNRTRYPIGPNPFEIKRETGQDAGIYQLEPANRPGTVQAEGNTIRMYQPMTVNRDKQLAPAGAIKAPQPVKEPQPVDRNNRGLFHINEREGQRDAEQPALPGEPRNRETTRPVQVPDRAPVQPPARQPERIPQQPSSPVRTPQAQPPARPQQPSAPVRTPQAQPPVRPQQQPSAPARSPQVQPTRPQQVQPPRQIQPSNRKAPGGGLSN